MSEKVCFTIAVSRPEQLEALPGTIEAARWMAAWAEKANFATHAITDENGTAVTVARLREEFVAVLSDAESVIEHLIVHFAGHGVAHDADDQFLLLSHWWSQPTESIKLNRFMRLLQYYQPKRVSLFIDACRSRQSVKTEEVDGSGILDRLSEEPVEFLEDRFRAAVYGSESYMVRNLSGVSPCMFSTILLKTLCGEYEEAVATRGTDRVVASAQIYNALRLHFPKEAAAHGVQVTPSLKPGFVDPNDVYTHLPIDCKPPDLPPPSLDKPGFGAGGPASSDDRNIVGPPSRPSRGRGRGAQAPRPPAPIEDAVSRSLLRNEIAASYESESRPTHFETGAGCAVIGADVGPNPPRATSPNIARNDQLGPNRSWWRLENGSNGVVDQPSSLLIELATGHWIGAAIVPRTIVTFSVGSRARRDGMPPSEQPSGAVSVIYRPTEGYIPDAALGIASSTSEHVIAGLRAGLLTGEDALNVAIRIRTDAYIDPISGAVAAYLYDGLGDRDGIRRIAVCYASRNQPIPFDVALLADLPGTRKDGRIRVDVPAVPARAPRTAAEKERVDYLGATGPIPDAVVAGGFPWLRQGWDLMDAVRLPVHPQVIELARTPGVLVPLPFTTLTPAAGGALARLIDRQEV